MANFGDGMGSPWPPTDVELTSRDEEINAVQIGMGSHHTCVLFDDARVRCWGAGGSGRLANGRNDYNIGDDPDEMPPPDVNTESGTVVGIYGGQHHGCTRYDGGAVRCWGDNRHGQLGYGNTKNRLSVTSDISVGGVATDVALGGFHTCVLLDTGKVRCWGYGEFGQLGTGDTEDIDEVRLW